MRRFTFYDTDSMGRADYDISGLEYVKLLEICFLYGHTCSFLLDSREPLTGSSLEKIAQYRIPVTGFVRDAYNHYGRFDGNEINNYEIRHYLLCDEVKKVIQEITDSMFKWICGWGNTNPTDPVFYRKDGTVFFHSVIHEGICTLTASNEENVDAITKSELWQAEGNMK